MSNEVRVLVRADTRQAQADIDHFSDSVGSGLGTATKIGIAAVAGLGAAAAGGLAVSINAAANFQQALSQVAAVSGATKTELDGLHDTALRIGKDTAFSATEAANAMEELAAQGVSATDIMGGAADATVALAAAGGTDLVTAATAASSAMNIWHLSTSNLTDVVNRLTGAANVSSFGVEDMTLAMAAGGIAAATFKISMEDTTTALAALAKGGFQSGSDAGTSFKAMLTNLAAPTGAGAKAIANLGINVRDASGAMLPMSAIIDELHRKLDGLSQEDKDAAMARIFGTDGMRAAGALMQITGDQFTEMSAKMGATDAASVAAVRMDNFKGSLEQLKGSLEVIEIEVGEKFLPVLTRMADWAAQNLPTAFDYFETEIEPKIKAFATEAATDINAFVDTVGPYLVRFGEVAREQFRRFQGYYQTDLKPAFDNIVTAVEYVVQKFRDNWGTIGPAVQKVAEVVKGQIEIIGNALQIIIDILGGDWKGAWENTKQLVQGVVDNWKAILDLGVLALKAAIAVARDVGADIVHGIAEGAENAWPAIRDALWAAKDNALAGLGNAADWLVDVGWDIIRGLVKGITDAANSILQGTLNWVSDKIPDWKGPPAKDATLLYETGKIIIGGLSKGVEDGATTTLLPALKAVTDSISSLYDNVPDYVKRLSPAAGGSKSNADPYVPFNTNWYVGGGQSAMGPSFEDTGKIPVGSYIPGLGYKTATGWEQTQGAAASIDQAYKNGTYGSGLLSGPQVIQLVVDGHTLARVVNDANARAGVA